ncbi:MAG: hypothetical protein PVG78_06175 [Desulfobacterales bacterium]|jgi:hypothetical protein
MVDSKKRQFFTRYLPSRIGRCVADFEAGLEDARRREEFDRFFSSYESSYALTLAYPDDIMMETARQYGIETEGRPKLDVVKELFLLKGGL